MAQATSPLRDEPRKSFLTRPWVRIVFAPLAVLLLGGIINEKLPKLHLVAGIGKFFVWLFKAKVPFLLFLVPVAATVILLYVVIRLRHKPSAAEGGQLTEGVASSPNTAPKKVVGLAIDPEHLAILAALGEAEESLLDGPLFDFYQKQFNGKSRIHFKLITNELQQAHMIDVDSDYEGEKVYTILSKGLDVLRERLGSSKTG